MFNLFLPFFTSSVKTSFGELFHLTGRLGRTSFIMSAVFMLVLIFNLGNILHAILGLFSTDFHIEDVFIHNATTVVWIVLCLMSVRRIHDVGYSVGVLLLGFVPYVGIFIVAWLLTLPGEPNVNVYGEPVEELSFSDLLDSLNE